MADATLDLLALDEAARTLGLSQKAVRSHIHAGRLAADREGGTFRVAADELRRFEASLAGAAKAQRTRARTPEPPQFVDVSRAWRRPGRSRLAFVDLFCGAGGLTKGLEMAGLRGTCGLDVFESAVRTHRRNFSHPIVSGDIRRPEVKRELLEAVQRGTDGAGPDVVAGGFPCQGFSISGYRVVDDARNGLYREMLELVATLRPSFVVAENVVGIRSMLDGRVEEAIVEDFARLGYPMRVAVLSAADHGVPQVRHRVFFVGNRLGLQNLHPAPRLDASRHATTREAIEDLVDRPADRAFNHVPTRHSASMAARLAAVPEGKSLYANYSDAWRKCPWDAPSCTIKENHGGVNVHPRLPRVLTAREMARLQSFPDDFVFEGSKGAQLVQIGNAVPPLLGKAVGLALRAMAGEIPGRT